ncbi:transcription termination/antitermination protein NusA [Geothermobacter hydrogeniphilus]|uniref:Transcription termination/antitermination protein NusA n=1 Tax=Geothermobacter hydrogeniphilus TaxID=1969733 RepID=A0A2K2HD67_9BACT|nr:transcription termination factor NusA [Geothermobacter hydrogeniphilus]PNU21193.1 transcription termination/antitermination protein NusA [Geothermobacter hydrogeniphilus]
MEQNLNQIIDQVVKDKGIDRSVLVEALEAAILSAANKKYRNTRDLEAQFNDEVGEVELFEFVTVVDEVEDSYREIDIEEAREIDPEVEIGDSLGMKMDATGFSRIAAQTAKQVIIQKVREAEREGIFNEFKDRIGELVNGIVRRYERGDLIVDLGRAEALLPHREQVPRENYRQGDRVRAYVADVRMSTKGPQIILSRTAPGLVASLFKTEVPEISEGIVEIVGVAREPGSRAKIAVVSHDSDVDPVGACVGMRGSRVQNVVSELRGEKIDIIPWTPDIARFACSALSPAEVTRVYVDNEEQALEVIVPDDQLSLAIGKKGQNVRLAARLTSWKIDIKSETRAAEAELEEEIENANFDNVAVEEEAVADVAAEDTAAEPTTVTDPAELSRDQLYELAKEHKLAGRSGMSKQELLDKLQELGVFAAAEDDDAGSGEQE